MLIPQIHHMPLGLAFQFGHRRGKNNIPKQLLVEQRRQILKVHDLTSVDDPIVGRMVKKLETPVLMGITK